jgi:hypothetical protein
MNYIGEFQKDSTILLELLTKDEKNQPIATDISPTATIEHYDRNGLQEVDNVKLETMGEGSRHTKLYQIPSDWKYGDYLITYNVLIEGIVYTTQEKFYISRTEELVQESNEVSYEILELMKSYTTDTTEDEPEEEPVTSAEGYIMTHEFQSPSSIEIVDNQIIITLEEQPLYNYTYQIVLDKDIRSTSGNRLGTTKTVTFTSEYKPLFATSMEVRSVLRSMFKYFTPHEIYTAIRDAGQKAMQLLGNNPDPNNARYRDIRSNDTSLFPTQKYVLYESSRSLMTGLMVRILSGSSEEEVEQGLGMTSETGGTMTLGDFSVSDKSSSSTGVGGVTGDSESDESPLQKLQVLIRETEKELKFWQDSMMGHNRRGYAKPISGSYRSEAGSPEGRDFA